MLTPLKYIHKHESSETYTYINEHMEPQIHIHAHAHITAMITDPVNHSSCLILVSVPEIISSVFPIGSFPLF